MVILLMGLEMLGKVVDALGENSDLNLGGTGDAVMESILRNDLAFKFLIHFITS